MLKLIFLRRICALTISVSGSIPQVAALESAPVEASAPAEWSEIRAKTFSVVWETVNGAYYDPTFGGIDWRAVREKYAVRLAGVGDNVALRQLLEGMLGELRRTHFAIVPRDMAVFTPAERVRIGTTGLEVVMVEGVTAVRAIKAESAAARAGVKVGDVVLRIDGFETKVLADFLAKQDYSPARCGLYLQGFVNGRLRSAVGATVKLTILRVDDEREREIELTSEMNAGPWSEPVGNFPSMPVECETQYYSPGVAHLRFNIFAREAMRPIRTVLKSLPVDGGLIIDLRGNGGGVSVMASGICGWLSDRRYLLGTMHLRQGHIGFTVEPQAGAFLGPVAVLIDSGSASTSEIMAAGMQEAGRARIFGECSPGAALPSQFAQLPSGDLLQYAVADLQTPKGVMIEGRGVTPDELVPQTLTDLRAGRDPALEAAKAWLVTARQHPAGLVLPQKF